MSQEAREATEAENEAYSDLRSEDVTFSHEDGCVVTYSYINGNIHIKNIEDPISHPKDSTTFFDKVRDDSWMRQSPHE